MNYHTLSRIHNYHLKIYAALVSRPVRHRDGSRRGNHRHHAGRIAAHREPGDGRLDGRLHRHEGARATFASVVAGHRRRAAAAGPRSVRHDDRRLALRQNHRACGARGRAAAEATAREVLPAVEVCPRRATCSTTPAATSSKIAEQMLLGEIEYRNSNFERRVTITCARPCTWTTTSSTTNPGAGCSPPGMRSAHCCWNRGTSTEAEQVYRDDLGLSDTLVSTSQHPDNLWSLHGLVECLERRGDPEQAKLMRARLNLAKARADVPVNASCACRLQHHCCAELTASVCLSPLRAQKFLRDDHAPDARGTRHRLRRHLVQRAPSRRVSGRFSRTQSKRAGTGFDHAGRTAVRVGGDDNAPRRTTRKPLPAIERSFARPGAAVAVLPDEYTTARSPDPVPCRNATSPNDDAMREKIMAASLRELEPIWRVIDDALDPGPYFLGAEYSICDMLFLMQAVWTENQPACSCRLSQRHANDADCIRTAGSAASYRYPQHRTTDKTQTNASSRYPQGHKGVERRSDLLVCTRNPTTKIASPCSQ